MKKLEKQTVYLGFLRFNRETFRIEGHIQKALAVNVHDSDFPIWDKIEYNGEVHPSTSSLENYYSGIGPWGEPCLVFTSLEKAVKRLFGDIHGYCKYSERMELYELVKPNIYTNEEYPEIYYWEKRIARLIEPEEIIDAIGGAQIVL